MLYICITRHPQHHPSSTLLNLQGSDHPLLLALHQLCASVRFCKCTSWKNEPTSACSPRLMSWHQGCHHTQPAPVGRTLHPAWHQTPETGTPPWLPSLQEVTRRSEKTLHRCSLIHLGKCNIGLSLGGAPGRAQNISNIFEGSTRKTEKQKKEFKISQTIHTTCQAPPAHSTLVQATTSELEQRVWHPDQGVLKTCCVTVLCREEL